MGRSALDILINRAAADAAYGGGLFGRHHKTGTVGTCGLISGLTRVDDKPAACFDQYFGGAFDFHVL